MSPIDAIMHAISMIVIKSRGFVNEPGALIEKMSQSVRNALKNLKSDDIRHDAVRKEYCDGNKEYYQNEKIKSYKLNFDKKILK